METPKYIWHLVAFPDSFVDGMRLMDEYEKADDKEAYEKFKNSRMYMEMLVGGRLRGTFSDKEKLLERIALENNPWGMCEGFYTYLVIEKHHLDWVDGCCFDDDTETWFKFEEICEDEWGYREIEKPEWLKRTVGFA